MRSVRCRRVFAVHWIALAAGVCSFLACPHSANKQACADPRTRVYGAAGVKMHHLEGRARNAQNDGNFSTARDLQNELLELSVTQLAEDDWRLKVVRSDAATFGALASLSKDRQDEMRRAIDLFKSGRQHLILERWEQAITPFEQSAAIVRELLGSENLVHCETLTKLANALTRAGDYNRARQVLQQNAESKRAFLGDDHPSYALTIAELGSVECELRDFDSAERHFLHALEIREQQFGGEFRDTVFALQEVAAMYLKKSDPQSAEKYAGRAVEISARTMSPWNANRILSQWRLAQCRAARNDLAQAEQIYREIVPEFEQLTCTVEAVDAAEIIKDYATVLSRLSRNEEADRMREWGRTIRANGVGAERPRGSTTSE